jgi:hypothetical protein
VRWGKPNLNGGEFVEYEYRVTSSRDRVEDYWQSIQEPQVDLDLALCAMPYDIEVRVVSRTSGHDRITGPAEKLRTSGYDCNVKMTMRVQFKGPDSISVHLTELNPGVPNVAVCVISVNGQTVKSTRCGGGSSPADEISIPPLPPAPDHTYEVVLIVHNIFDPKFTSSTVVCDVERTVCGPEHQS